MPATTVRPVRCGRAAAVRGGESWRARGGTDQDRVRPRNGSSAGWRGAGPPTSGRTSDAATAAWGGLDVDLPHPSRVDLVVAASRAEPAGLHQRRDQVQAHLFPVGSCSTSRRPTSISRSTSPDARKLDETASRTVIRLARISSANSAAQSW
jgi:hypothetical protein